MNNSRIRKAACGWLGAAVTIAASPALGADQISLKLGKLNQASFGRSQQVLAITNNGADPVTMVYVECGFFHGGELFASGSNIVENIAAGTTGYATVSANADGRAERADCRITSMR